MPYDPYSAAGGHFYAAQRSGELAATIGALGHLARLRCPSSTSVILRLKRIKVGITVSAAVTTAVEFNLRAIVVRNFTTDFTTAITAVVPSKARGTMTDSITTAMISTTTVMSGQTLTADAAPFAMATFPGLVPVTATGTAVALPVGFGTASAVLYERTAEGQHDVMLRANEGVVIQPVTAGPASGTFALYVEWTWSEVLAA